MENVSIPNPLGTPIPIACKKLNIPKTAPMMHPPTGPTATAAIAIGTILSVMDNGPMGKVPNGVVDMINTIDANNPKVTSCFVDNFFIFTFPPVIVLP